MNSPPPIAATASLPSLNFTLCNENHNIADSAKVHIESTIWYDITKVLEYVLRDSMPSSTTTSNTSISAVKIARIYVKRIIDQTRTPVPECSHTKCPACNSLTAIGSFCEDTISAVEHGITEAIHLFRSGLFHLLGSGVGSNLRADHGGRCNFHASLTNALKLHPLHRAAFQDLSVLAAKVGELNVDFASKVKGLCHRWIHLTQNMFAVRNLEYEWSDRDWMFRPISALDKEVALDDPRVVRNEYVLCDEPFADDKIPILAPCGHIFCCLYICNWVNKVPESDRDDVVQVRCPLYRFCLVYGLEVSLSCSAFPARATLPTTKCSQPSEFGVQGCSITRSSSLELF